METIAENLAASYPDANAEQGIAIIPLTETVVGDLKTTMWLLVGAVSFFLVIACANVTNLLLARSLTRKQEFAIRVALGAGRGRILRQVFTETALISVLGGSVGVALAAYGTQAALSVLPTALPDIAQVGMNLRVLAFTLGIVGGTTALCALTPACTMMETNRRHRLRAGRSGDGFRNPHTQHTFIVAEIAMTFLLLIAAGLMTRSALILWRMSPGFRPDGVVTFTTALSTRNASTPEMTVHPSVRFTSA
jgi:predicted lysophospholipase L1 biosynthesis ABC-type transport system permease subunit